MVELRRRRHILCKPTQKIVCRQPTFYTCTRTFQGFIQDLEVGGGGGGGGDNDLDH